MRDGDEAVRERFVRVVGLPPVADDDPSPDPYDVQMMALLETFVGG